MNILKIISVRHELQTSPNAPLFFARKDYALFISINACGKNERHIFSTSVHVNRRGRWKGNISRGAKIPHDPWKTSSKTFRFV